MGRQVGMEEEKHAVLENPWLCWPQAFTHTLTHTHTHTHTVNILNRLVAKWATADYSTASLLCVCLHVHVCLYLSERERKVCVCMCLCVCVLYPGCVYMYIGVSGCVTCGVCVCVCVCCSVSRQLTRERSHLGKHIFKPIILQLAKVHLTQTVCWLTETSLSVARMSEWWINQALEIKQR